MPSVPGMGRRAAKKDDVRLAHAHLTRMLANNLPPGSLADNVVRCHCLHEYSDAICLSCAMFMDTVLHFILDLPLALLSIANCAARCWMPPLLLPCSWCETS
jgi:hypothetical protein